MSASFFKEGKEYVSAVIAAKNFDYTKEYILLLIKQEKIDGAKFENRWYVHLPSVEEFFAQAKKTRVEWREQIRDERRRELAQVTGVMSQDKGQDQRRVAVVETFAILLAGSIMGGLVYFASTPSSSQVSEKPVMEQIALSLYALVSKADPHSNFAAVARLEPTTMNDTESATPKSQVESLVVFKEDDRSAQKVESIRNSFSDPVSITIDSEHGDTGVIVPKFKNHTGEAYRFLMVPVTQDPQSNQ